MLQSMIEPISDKDKNHLQTVHLNKQLIEIPTSSFLKCTSLRSVTIPSTVKSIADNAFRSTTSNKEFIVDSNSVFQSIDGVLFDKSNNKLMFYPPSKEVSTYLIPKTTTAINNYAFIYDKSHH